MKYDVSKISQTCSSSPRWVESSSKEEDTFYEFQEWFVRPGQESDLR